MAERKDAALEALSNVHRRRLLLELREHDPHGEVPHASLRTLAESELLVEMTHVHLPKLAAAGYVEWDREEGAVLRGPRFEDVVPLLDAFDESGVALDIDGV